MEDAVSHKPKKEKLRDANGSDIKHNEYWRKSIGFGNQGIIGDWEDFFQGSDVQTNLTWIIKNLMKGEEFVIEYDLFCMREPN